MLDLMLMALYNYNKQLVASYSYIAITIQVVSSFNICHFGNIFTD